MSHMLEEYSIPSLKNFRLRNLRIESKHLKNNPLKDSNIKTSVIMEPLEKGPHPVVFVLAGFTGNGPKYLGLRSFEENMADAVVGNHGGILCEVARLEHSFLAHADARQEFSGHWSALG